MSDRSDLPRLLILRTGARAFREYLLESLSRHYRIHLFLGVEPSWELQYVDGWTEVDSLDVEAMTRTVHDLHAADPFSGVFCWDEARTPQAAALAEALGLPGSTAAIARCRDKHLTRQALAAAGVAQPQSVVVTDLDQAAAVAEAIGYPVVLKPSELALSVGVVVVQSPDDLAGAFAHTSGVRNGQQPDWRPTVLLEEYVDGEEISVDSVVHHGEVQPLCVARKEIGYAPYCVEVGHMVYPDDPLLSDPELVKLLHEAHAALGFTDGVTHTEIKRGSRGMRIIEVNGRLGGDMIPYLGLRATGVDVGLAAAAAACGTAPDVVRDRHEVAGIRFCYPESDGTTIETARFDTAGLPEAVDRTEVLAVPGSVKSPPPKGTVNGRIAFVTAVAPSAAQVRAALDAAVAALRVND